MRKDSSFCFLIQLYLLLWLKCERMKRLNLLFSARMQSCSRVGSNVTWSRASVLRSGTPSSLLFFYSFKDRLEPIGWAGWTPAYRHGSDSRIFESEVLKQKMWRRGNSCFVWRSAIFNVKSHRSEGIHPHGPGPFRFFRYRTLGLEEV